MVKNSVYHSVWMLQFDCRYFRDNIQSVGILGIYIGSVNLLSHYKVKATPPVQTTGAEVKMEFMWPPQLTA